MFLRIVQTLAVALLIVLLGSAQAVRATRPSLICYIPPPPYSLIGWWPLDETSGTVAVDLKSGMNGTIQFDSANTTTAFMAGKVAGSFHFRPTTSATPTAMATVTIPNDNRLNFGKTKDFTIDAWVSTYIQSGEAIGTDQTYNTIFEKVGTGQGYSFGFLGDGTLQMSISGSGQSLVVTSQSPVLLPDSTWRHISVVVVRNGGVSFYVNGVLIPSVVFSQNYAAAPRTDGMDISPSAPAHIGHVDVTDLLQNLSLDEMEIFGRALPQSELAQIIGQGKCKTSSMCVAPPPDMDAWYPFDGDGTERILGNNAVVHNAISFPAGEVVNAAEFDGGYLQVANTPVLNEGMGDFSIDAWVYFPSTWSSSLSQVRTLIDKRQQIAGKPHGYSLYVWKNYLGLQLADGGANAGYTNYNDDASPGFQVVTPGWHHIAVTVARSNQQGLVFYVDGFVHSTRNPTDRQGNLDNSAPLAFGLNELGGLPATGAKLDEVEFFDRVLQPYEIEEIDDAGSSGKCKP